MELQDGLMEGSMKEIGKREREMALELCIIRMATYMKDFMRMISNMEKEIYYLKIVRNMRVILNS